MTAIDSLELIVGYLHQWDIKAHQVLYFHLHNCFKTTILHQALTHSLRVNDVSHNFHA